jgi:hypothetical protein
MPGRIVILHDPPMDGHEATINQDRVEENVLLAVRKLTGIDDTGAAFESLFPGVSISSTFAIKVNSIGPNYTRWEVARGVVSGLSQMFGGTFDVGQVTIFDRDRLSWAGYYSSQFVFNENSAMLRGYNNASGSGHEPYPGYELSRWILNADYLINVPVLKSHLQTLNQITVALKNHYGSCYPSSLCNNIEGMLTVNSDAEIKDKTCLLVTDAIRATYDGGPTTPTQTWQTYAEGTPNTLLVTTDPVTNEYWARDIINAERLARGMAEKPCPWIEEASGDPYALGVSDPDAMTVLHSNPYLGVESGGPAIAVGTTFLAANVPNPFSSSTTLHFRMGREGKAVLRVYDASGRLVRHLERCHYPAGYHQTAWDGRDANGASVAPGVYFVRLETNHRAHTRRVVVVR